MARRDSSNSAPGGFDFAGFDFGRLDLSALAGSGSNARAVSFLQNVAKAEQLREGFGGEALRLQTDVRDQLVDCEATLRQTRSSTARIYESRIAGIDAQIEGVSQLRQAGKAAPSARGRGSGFEIAGKARGGADDLGLPGLVAQAYFDDDGRVTVLSEIATDADGNYALWLSPEQLGDRQEVHVRMIDFQGEPVEGSEKCLGCRTGGGDVAVIDLDETDAIRPALDRARRTSARRTARVEGLRRKRDAYRAQGDRDLAELDHQIACCEELLAEVRDEIPEGTTFPNDPHATRLLGNTSTRELHDLERQQAGCQIGEIRFDHRYYFDDEKTALAAGYDYCAHCYGRDRSRR